MDKSYLKISVVTPSFNQGSFIEETICSVLSQGYPNLEYIVIDGGSNDNSVEIIKQYEERLTYWISERDEGQSHALNKGFEKCTGDVVTWLNSDDCFTANSLFQINELFTKYPDIDFVHGKSILFGEDLKDKIVGDHSKTNNLNMKYFSCISFPQPSSFFRRSLLNDNSLLENLHYGMDYHFYLNAILKGAKGTFVNEIFSKYRLHPESKSNHELKFANDWSKVFSKFLLSIPNGKDYIEFLNSVNLFYDTNDRFMVRISFTDQQIKEVFLEHLNVQIHYHYQALDFRNVVKIVRLVKKTDPDFYIENRLNRILVKSILPKFIVILLRKLIRL